MAENSTIWSAAVGFVTVPTETASLETYKPWSVLGTLGSTNPFLLKSPIYYHYLPMDLPLLRDVCERVHVGCAEGRKQSEEGGDHQKLAATEKLLLQRRRLNIPRGMHVTAPASNTGRVGFQSCQAVVLTLRSSCGAGDNTGEALCPESVWLQVGAGL